MAFLGKLGNVLEDAASFAVPAGLFALGTVAGGGNPLLGKALMGAAASGAGGFARNEEEERIRKAQEEARRSSAVANLMNAISPGTGARGAAPVMPKAGFMETVARAGAQGYDFYKKADMAARAAKELKNRIAKQAFEEAQRTGEMAAAANFDRGAELVDAPTPLTDTLNKQRGGGGAKGVTQLGEFGPRGPVNPFASDPTGGISAGAAGAVPAAELPASFKSVVEGPSPAGKTTARPGMPASFGSVVEAQPPAGDMPVSAAPTGMPASFESVVEAQPPAGGMPGRFSAITGGGMRPEAAAGAQAMEAPPSAVDPFLQRPLSLTNIPTDTSLAGGQPSSIGLQSTPYERRVLQDVENPFDRETQPTEFGSYEQETRRLQANAGQAARAEEQIEIQRQNVDIRLAEIAAKKVNDELLRVQGAQTRRNTFIDTHMAGIAAMPAIEKYAQNQADLQPQVKTINKLLSSETPEMSGLQQMMAMRVIQRAIDDAQVTETDLIMNMQSSGFWKQMKVKFDHYTKTGEAPVKIIGDSEIKEMVFFLEQTNQAIEEQAISVINSYGDTLRELGYEGVEGELIDDIVRGGLTKYNLFKKDTTPMAAPEFTSEDKKRHTAAAKLKALLAPSFRSLIGEPGPELQSAALWSPGQAPMGAAAAAQQQKYMGGQLKDFGTGFVNLLGQFARERPEDDLGGRRSIGYAGDTSGFLKSLGYGGGG